jgi:hypothetical protein
MSISQMNYILFCANFISKGSRQSECNIIPGSGIIELFYVHVHSHKL